MSESYSAEEDSGPGTALARELIARLIPSADAGLLVEALLAERAAGVPAPAPAGSTPAAPRADRDAPAREARRVRTQLELGEAARMAQHALNNPLTALLAEAQLLELEPLSSEHLRAVGRMIELARRIAKVARRLDGSAEDRAG